MNHIGIVIDSTILLDEETKSKIKDLEIVCLSVVSNGESTKELDITEEKIMIDSRNGINYKTSQPSPIEFEKAYTNLLNKGYNKIFVFTLSSKISGTYQSANIAKNNIDQIDNIYVFDTDIANYGVSNLVKAFVDEMQINNDFDSLIAFGNEAIKNAYLSFTVLELQHLYRGGRLSKLSAAIGVLLRIKPVIAMVNGKLEVVQKARTNQAIIESFTEKIHDFSSKFKKVYLRLVDKNHPDMIETILDKIKELKNIVITKTKSIGPVFTIHIGDQGYGIALVGVN